VAKILLIAAYDVSVTDSQALDAPQPRLCVHASHSLIVNALNPCGKLEGSGGRFFVAEIALSPLLSTPRRGF
jgi:hypothetical protein